MAGEPGTFLFLAALLTVMALAASYIPARHAPSVVPMVALRYE
jgi:ABC-type lipoprotein release transport system permease subunit